MSDGTEQPRPRRRGRVINAAELDPEQINVVKGAKVDKRTLIHHGDSEDQRRKVATLTEDERNTVVGQDATKCNVCCMACGALLTTTLSMGVCLTHVGIAAFKDQHRVNLTVAAFFRQVGWMVLPPALVGTTLHYFVSEAMWSKKRSTYGTAWAKALGMNTVVWASMIGGGTLFWQRGLKMTKWGQKIFYKYPAATQNLDLRLVENPKAFWTGMTWTYWALGLFTGQLGYGACVGVVVFQNRVHLLMSPVGQYAMACTPWWRREHIASQANTILVREGSAEARAIADKGM